MKKIVDEFTDLPISSQRKRHLRIRRDKPEVWKEMSRVRGKKRYVKNREYIKQRNKRNYVIKMLQETK